MKNHILLSVIIAASAACAGLAGCERSQTQTELPAASNAVVSDGGKTITFPADCPGLKQISVLTASKGSITTSVIAPSRVVANIPAESASNRVIIFESPDATTLYSQYRQSRANVDLAMKNQARVKDMFDNHGATAKDLNQAETDVANAKAVQSEMEGRLRSSGFNPSELDNAPAGSVWIMSDVTEAQLTEVEKGEAVDVYFNAFPGKKFEGHAMAIGDALDPLTRTVKVRIIMRNPLGRIIPGMFAKVDFGDPKNNVIVIPLSSVFTVEGKNYVFVETAPATFTRRQVVLTPPVGSRVIVQNGVALGEKVVTEGAMLLKGLSFNY